ncbi:MAG: hypothetical protein RR886_09095 [Cellulosilyticaceae bacterium]
MSAFLGEIHHWLYNKIQLQQDLVEEIIKLAEKAYHFPLREELDATYGTSETRPLEEVIDETNIHGWLQNKVAQVEYKLAYSMKRLIEVDSQAISKIQELFTQKGKEKRASLQAENIDASELYEQVSNHLLDGMPCDHASTVIESSEDQVVWRRNTCVHSKYWEAVGIDVKVYYVLREAWLLGFLSGENEAFEQIDEVTYSLKKEK